MYASIYERVLYAIKINIKYIFAAHISYEQNSAIQSELLFLTVSIISLLKQIVCKKKKKISVNLIQLNWLFTTSKVCLKRMVTKQLATCFVVRVCS